MDGGAQNDQVLPFRFRVSAGIFHDGQLHQAEVDQPQAYQDQRPAAEALAAEMVDQHQGGDEQQGAANIGVAPHTKQEEGRRSHQQRHRNAPEGKMFNAHWFSSSHFSYSSISSVSKASFSAAISISFW